MPRSSTGGRRRTAGRSAPPWGARQVGCHDLRGPSVEGERGHHHPAVPNRNQLRLPVTFCATNSSTGSARSVDGPHPAWRAPAAASRPDLRWPAERRGRASGAMSGLRSDAPFRMRASVAPTVSFPVPRPWQGSITSVLPGRQPCRHPERMTLGARDSPNGEPSTIWCAEDDVFAAVVVRAVGGR